MELNAPNSLVRLNINDDVFIKFNNIYIHNKELNFASIELYKHYETIDFEYHNLKDWEKYLYDLYYQRLYYWQEKTTVRAFHFKKVKIQHDGGDFGSDYEYTAKKRRKIIPYPDNLIIEKDFIKIQKYPRRINLTYGPVIIPEVKVYKDKNTKWWDD